MKFKSLLFKIISCLFAGVASIQTILYVGKLLPSSLWTQTIKLIGAIVFIFIPLISTIIFPLVWQRIEKKELSRSNIIFAWLHALIRFCFAAIIFSYGFAKLLGLQFQKIYSVADIPLRQQDGTSLTWSYFGFSFLFVCIIGSIQIIGSLLLLFRKTYMAGVLILLPVMINILCIDLVYKIDDGALINSILLSTGLVYLLLLEYESFIQFFDKIQNHLPSIIKGKIFLKLSLRAAIILLPFFATLNWKNSIQKESPISGIYEVEKMTIDSMPFNFDSVRRSDSVLTRIYFETNNVCVLQYNNTAKRITIHYAYNAGSSQLYTVPDNQPGTAMKFTVSKLQNSYIGLSGTLSKNNLNLILKKIE